MTQGYQKEYQKWYRDTFPEKHKQSKRRAVARSFSPTVYAYFDNGCAVYVGKTNFFKRRIADHRKYSKWWKEPLLVVSISCKDEWEAMEYEGKWGGHYRPVENIDGQRRVKYDQYKDVE
jgi:predicted GIY-YIG superfamily endonuclease